MPGERDIFIAHAHQDKVLIVRPLAEALGRHAMSCWIDEGQIGPGDSLIDAMNDGLRTSRVIVPTITPRFLSAPWGRRELNAALQLEAQQGATKVVPVVAVDPGELTAFPLLLDKLWLDWGDGPDAVAARIATMFERRPARDWTVDPPENYVGQVWARVNADASRYGESHTVTFRWGPFLRRETIESLEAAPVSMLFHKTQPDRVPLHVEVVPDAILTFGVGAPPDPRPRVIDEGWVRAAGWNFPDGSKGSPADRSADEANRLIATPDESYHVRISRFLRSVEEFNLTNSEVIAQYVEPWRAGQGVSLKGRLWEPATCRISIYRGQRLTTQQRSLGRGWSRAMEFGEDVTDALLRDGV